MGVARRMPVAQGEGGVCHAIIRQIAAKGDAARFRKVEKGTFAANSIAA